MKDTTRSNLHGETSLRAHLMPECLAMAKYALSSGLKVSATLVQTLESLAAQESGAQGRDAASAKTQDTQGNTSDESQPGDVAKALATIHSRLAEIVAPATPRTIRLLTDESARGVLGFLGPVRLVRRMGVVSILCLIAFIAISLSPTVDVDSISKSIFDKWPSSIALLYNLLFYLTAAGLGGCFAALFQANRYIAATTFDPKYESSYWIRFILGLMAGLILTELVPMPQEGAQSTGNAIAKPALALLGGFSAAMVYRIINRLVESLESVVRGEAKELAAAEVQAAKVSVDQKAAQERLKLAANLTKLQQQLHVGGDPEASKGELDRILKGLIPSDEDEQEAGSTPAPQAKS